MANDKLIEVEKDYEDEIVKLQLEIEQTKVADLEMMFEPDPVRPVDERWQWTVAVVEKNEVSVNVQAITMETYNIA